MTFNSPVDDMLFTIKHIAGLDELLTAGFFSLLDQDLVEAILTEAGKFADENIAPLNKVGDEQGARLVDGQVILPDLWAEVYKSWIESGWASLPGAADFGGQGLPMLLSAACNELWNSSAMAFGLCPMLTQGAVNALTLHGSEALKEKFLAKLISGEWTGTMLLTEPHAGSDLGGIRSSAVRAEDGSFRLSGTKIFITYGEHSMTENIIHMVLARIEGAPAGTKGISLFLVPKFLVGDNGDIGERNDIYCSKLEEKLGIHASPTCVMNFGDEGGAVGYLVGEENRGLNAMFAMMNEARLVVGIQGVGIAERAHQQAVEYARERQQGRAIGDVSGEMSPIIKHPDIRRTLMSCKAKIFAARAISYMVAKNIDVAENTGDVLERRLAENKVALLTPVAKAYSTDIGVEVASEGVQVHGGMGYVEETGAAQHYRDARISPIYEGTNGIQAIDLVTRKLTLANGEAVKVHIKELFAIAEDLKAHNSPAFGKTYKHIEEAITYLDNATNWMQQNVSANMAFALAGATPYLKLFAVTTGAAYLVKGCLSLQRSEDHSGLEKYIAITRFYAENICIEAASLEMIVTNGTSAFVDERYIA